MKKLLRLNVNNNVEIFSFSLQDKLSFQKLKWESDDEFSFNGKMYDVIGRKIEDGKIIIRCIGDKKETALVNTLKDNWKENERCNKIANELFQLLQTLFHNTKPEEIVFGELTSNNSFFQLEALPLRVKKIPTPPPQRKSFSSISS